MATTITSRKQVSTSWTCSQSGKVCAIASWKSGGKFTPPRQTPFAESGVRWWRIRLRLGQDLWWQTNLWGCTQCCQEKLARPGINSSPMGSDVRPNCCNPQFKGWWWRPEVKSVLWKRFGKVQEVGRKVMAKMAPN